MNSLNFISHSQRNHQIFSHFDWLRTRRERGAMKFTHSWMSNCEFHETQWISSHFQVLGSRNHFQLNKNRIKKIDVSKFFLSMRRRLFFYIFSMFSIILESSDFAILRFLCQSWYYKFTIKEIFFCSSMSSFSDSIWRVA